MWQKARAQPSQGGAGWPGFGANEITLSTRVMLSWSEEDSRWESRCGHETCPPGHPRWLADLTSGPPSPTFAQSTDLTPLSISPTPPGRSGEESVSLASKVFPSKFSSSKLEREERF
jgi:hypothetical protein